MIEILAFGVLLVLFVLAAFDVFWPFTVALALIALGVWWRDGVAVFRHLWRPEIIVGYIVAGFVWVFFKWTRVVDASIKNGDRRAPKWADHSVDFTAYFFYWPADVIAYILSDFLRSMWNFIARMVGRSFDRYAEWRFASSLDRTIVLLRDCSYVEEAPDAYGVSLLRDHFGYVVGLQFNGCLRERAGEKP